MLRKIRLISVGLLTVASTCHAGFYIGAGLGPDTVDYKQQAHVYHIYK